MIGALRRDLVEHEANGTPVRVGVVGAGGAMGRGVCLQLGLSPGFELTAAVDVNRATAEEAVGLYEQARRGRGAPRAAPVMVSVDGFDLLGEEAPTYDVLVESTDTVAWGARLCEGAIRSGHHVVLMNAEIDCLLGPYLAALADQYGVVVTSDAGDQHGVLARMIDEALLWGFEVVVAGNIKGFLDRQATPASMVEEARIRSLSPHMCSAFTDGTKLCVEMAITANAFDLTLLQRGMSGPPLHDVRQVLGVLDLDRAESLGGVVDYVLGAEPGGGVFLVVRSEHPAQHDYLRYYKLGDGPYYLLYRPYHLCHIETPVAVASAALWRRPLLVQRAQLTEVIAVAKSDIRRGHSLERGIGSDVLYGTLEDSEVARAVDAVPICLLDQEQGEHWTLRRDVPAGEILTWDDVTAPDSWLLDAFRSQGDLLA
jgi:predicted homoserine dehydrogenase-like protein